MSRYKCPCHVKIYLFEYLFKLPSNSQDSCWNTSRCYGINYSSRLDVRTKYNQAQFDFVYSNFDFTFSVPGEYTYSEYVGPLTSMSRKLYFYLYFICISVASGEKPGFQITLLLSSYVYLDVFQDYLPPFEQHADTPAALVFFNLMILIQFISIIGIDSTYDKDDLSTARTHSSVESNKSVFMGATTRDE